MERMIIAAAKNKDDLNGKSEELKYIYIGGGYMIDLERSVQFRINNVKKQRQIYFKNGLLSERP
jgi:hypothetical protein